MFGTWINSVATRFDRRSRFCAALLVSGTTLALYGQFITNVVRMVHTYRIPSVMPQDC